MFLSTVIAIAFAIFIVTMTVIAIQVKGFVWQIVSAAIGIVATIIMAILFHSWLFPIWAAALAILVFLVILAIEKKKTVFIIVAIIATLVVLVVGVLLTRKVFYDRLTSVSTDVVLVEDVESDISDIIKDVKPDITINSCPTEAIGVHPHSGEALIFKENPYPGVLCEYELYYDNQTAQIKFEAGQAALVADWAATCPTGAACEGVWTATSAFDVPAGWLVHVYVYTSGYSAAARFPTFACEYVAGHSGHTNANIRVAPWALDSGSVFDHPGCPLN